MSASQTQSERPPGAAVRLWRRAPVWRAMIGMAVVFAALTALYPVELRQTMPAVESTYVPLMPANIFGPSYRSFVTIGSRKFPLPSGLWHAVQYFTSPTPPNSGVLYARVSGNKLTGLFIAMGSTVPAATPMHFVEDENCSRTAAYKTGRIAGDDPNLAECWGVAGLDTAARLAQRAPGGRLHQLLVRLREGGVELPPYMITMDWFQADDRQFAIASYAFVPPAGLDAAPPVDWQPEVAALDPGKAAFISAVEAWTADWAALLERGVKGDLTAADVTSALARHTQ